MSDRTVDIRARLDQARIDLSQGEAALAALEAEKADASASRQSFEKWRADHAATTIERERLLLLLQTLEEDLARSDAADADKELRKQYAEKVAANAELARRNE